MNQYQRIQLKYQKANKAFIAAKSHRRRNYWSKVMNKIMDRKVSKQAARDLRFRKNV